LGGRLTKAFIYGINLTIEHRLWGELKLQKHYAVGGNFVSVKLTVALLDFVTAVGVVEGMRIVVDAELAGDLTPEERLALRGAREVFRRLCELLVGRRRHVSAMKVACMVRDRELADWCLRESLRVHTGPEDPVFDKVLDLHVEAWTPEAPPLSQ